MPTFIVLMNYTDQGIKGIKEAPGRIAEWEKAIATGRGQEDRRLHSYGTIRPRGYCGDSE